MHRLLKRQLKRSGLDPESLPQEMETFLQNVNDAYQQFDEHRDMLERSMELSSKEILAALKEAEDANQLKSMFVAKVSHEIRTPMNAILGMAQILLEGELSDETRECIDIVQVSAETLLRLINDLLDFSKIEAGKLDLSTHAFDITATVKNSERLLSALLMKESIEMVVHVDDNVPKQVLGDMHRVTQIVMNLLSNAVKFNRRGGIILYLECIKQVDDEVTLSISVSDTGVGIPEEKLDEIFGAFTQVEGTDNRKYGGTGLGLTICRQLVELMSGEMVVQSKVGVGSRFTFACPFKIDYTDRTASSDLQNSFGNGRLDGTVEEEKRVLVAEDNPVNQKVIRKILERRGYSVEIASTGRIAVESFEGNDFDLVFLDIQMPEIDGYEATRIIREVENSQNRSAVPIIALTAHVGAGEVQKCEEAGMNGFVSKPIDVKALFQEIQKVTSSD